MSTSPNKSEHTPNSGNIDRRHGHDHLFHLYNTKSEDQDQDFLTDCNAAMDSLLVFAGLFSAVTTALIVESYKDLKPDPTDRTDQLLAALLRRSGNSSAPYELSSQIQFSATAAAVVTNALFFLSLCVSLMAALSAILIKQWARNFSIGLRQISSAPRRARKHFQRSRAIENWEFGHIIAWVPMMLHLSLVLFFAGLIIWLWSLNRILFSITIIFAGISGILYLGGATITSFDPNAPFEWPIATLLRNTILKKHVNRHLSTQESMPLVERNTLVPTIVTTPLDSFDSITYDSSSQPPTQLDLMLISEFVSRADTYLEIEAALHQLHQIITKSEINLSGIPLKSVNIFIQCAADLILACRANDHNRSTIQRGIGFQRATTALQFFEAILQVVPIDLETCGEYLRSTIRMTRIYHTQALELQDTGLIALSASCLARMESQLVSNSDIASLLESTPALMSTLLQLGPHPVQPTNPAAMTSPKKIWPIEAVRQYQVSITAYLASFLQLLTTCDAKGLQLDTKVVDGIFKISKRLVQNAYVPVYRGQIENHPILLDYLKSRWLNIHGPNNNSVVPRLLQHLISTIGYDASIGDDGRHDFQVKQIKSPAAFRGK